MPGTPLSSGEVVMNKKTEASIPLAGVGVWNKQIINKHQLYQMVINAVNNGSGVLV